MADFRQIPPPNYDYQIAELVKYYREALQNIIRSLDRLNLDEWSRAIELAILKDIAETLKKLDKDAATWVEQYIPLAAQDGVERALIALGVAQTYEEARKIVRFNRANQRMVEAMVADTMDDVLAVTQNVSRRTRTVVRQVAAAVMRGKLTEGVTDQRVITRNLKQELRKQLGDGADTAIIDSMGRRWRIETYVDMLARTKLMQAHMEATVNEAVAREAFYGVISSHGATDPCRYHEGRIVKLVDSAPGDYPTIDELRATQQIFHPCCRHLITPTRSIERLPESVRQKAERQAIRGNAAIATGKRNPSESDLGL